MEKEKLVRKTRDVQTEKMKEKNGRGSYGDMPLRSPWKEQLSILLSRGS